MSMPNSSHRLRSYIEFLAAILYFFVARSLARHSAPGWARDGWVPLVEQTILAMLLIAGFTLMGRLIEHQGNSVAAQGFPFRSGWPSEARLGIVLGWGASVICLLPMTVVGGIAVRLNLHPSEWLWWFGDLLFFAVLALVEEVAFRGYGFQSLEKSIGSSGAVIVFSVFYTILQVLLIGSTTAGIAMALVFNTLLTMAYLRTRALWLSWGLNFGWHASRGVLFGLVVAGVSTHSSVVQSDPMGPWWLTGGGYGLDASWIAILLMLAGFPLVYSLTRDLDFEHNAPVIVPGGMVVDIDAAARRQHEAAMGTAAPTEPQLVQIAGADVPVASASGTGQNPPQGKIDSE